MTMVFIWPIFLPSGLSVSDRLRSCRAFTSGLPAILPYAAILVGYGTTESGPVTFGAHPDGVPLPSLSYGYPHPEIDVRLNDDSVLETVLLP